MARIFMKSILFVLFTFFMIFLLHAPASYSFKLVPLSGYLYHGIYPGGFSGEEDDFSEYDIVSYESHVDKKAAFVYFSNNWFNSKEFPEKTVSWIYKRESIPYIRLMLRASNTNQEKDESQFGIARINNGYFDHDLRDWFVAARNTKKPLFVEYGIEVNGDWFPWNGVYNGGEKEGTSNFKKAYKRIINIARSVGARNVEFSFHVNSTDSPDVEWNRFENYYPGDDYIDLLTTSIYGMLTCKDIQVRTFTSQLDKVYERLMKMSPNKKVIVIEFGSALENTRQVQEEFAQEAFQSMLSNRWPNLIGFSYWNEFWPSKGCPMTTLRVQDNPRLEKVFQENLLNKRILSDMVFE